MRGIKSKPHLRLLSVLLKSYLALTNVNQVFTIINLPVFVLPDHKNKNDIWQPYKLKQKFLKTTPCTILTYFRIICSISVR